jgi:hypothetical protein
MRKLLFFALFVNLFLFSKAQCPNGLDSICIAKSACAMDIRSCIKEELFRGKGVQTKPDGEEDWRKIVEYFYNKQTVIIMETKKIDQKTLIIKNSSNKIVNRIILYKKNGTNLFTSIKQEPIKSHTKSYWNKNLKKDKLAFNKTVSKFIFQDLVVVYNDN